MTKSNDPEDLSDELADLPTDAIEPLTEDVPRATTSIYDAFYDPPASDVAGLPSDGPDEPLEPVPDELKHAAPPAEYVDYYDSPAPDDAG